MRPCLAILTTSLLLCAQAFAAAAEKNPPVVSPPAVSGVERAKPNILVILADDLGYGDVQCYNPQRGKIPTPNIDRLASQGMRFTDAHSSSGVCSPSRYSLLTGRYHWRTRLQRFIVGAFDKPLIVPDRLTIGGLAKAQGYRTACIGKWHLGFDWPITPDQASAMLIPCRPGKEAEVPWTSTAETVRLWSEIFSKPIKGGPTACGFDRYFGVNGNGGPPHCFLENEHTVGIPSDYLSLDTAKLARTQGPAVKDWRLEKMLPTLGDQAIAFMDQAASARKPYLVYLALTAPHTPLAVNQEWRGKSGLNDYADFVMETDALVGRVLNALEKSGAATNTLVILTSDNGCAHYIGMAELEKKGHYPSGALRGSKATAWEGGHRMPFIVRWPGMVRPGAICNQLAQQSDLMATIADIFSVRLPENAGEDSVSLLPLFRGEDRPVREQGVSTSLDGIPAVRQGSWKLILGNPSYALHASEEGPQPIQLYNLADDLGETNDLAATHPERVAQMRALYENCVSDGRSTPGAAQKNDVEVKLFPSNATEKPAQQPAKPIEPPIHTHTKNALDIPK